MSQSMQTSLEAIIQNLKHLSRPIVPLLQPGLSAAAIDSMLGPHNLVANDELRALYEWHNGTKVVPGVTLDDLHFFPGFYLLSLEDAIVNVESHKSDDRWDPAWLPVFANGGGDFYVVSAGGKEKQGEVRYFGAYEAEASVEFLSLGAMFSTLQSAFDQGIFFVDSRGYLEMDDQAFNELAAKAS